MLVSVEWEAIDRDKFYNYRQYMQHINGCSAGGDQACACGMASVRWNIGELLDQLDCASPPTSAGEPHE